MGKGKKLPMDEHELKANLGKNIKFYRFRSQLSQADLAERAKISITFLSNIERGNNYPQAGTLCNIAHALNVEIYSLFKNEITTNEEKSLIDNISEDFSKHVNLAIETVCKQYKV